MVWRALIFSTSLFLLEILLIEIFVHDVSLYPCENGDNAGNSNRSAIYKLVWIYLSDDFLWTNIDHRGKSVISNDKYGRLT